MSISQLSISALKADFSRVLQRVAQGERIAITKRGKVVAELQPPDKKTRSINEVRGLLASARKQRKVSLEDMNIDRRQKKAHPSQPSKTRTERESAKRLARLGGSEPKLIATQARRRG